MISARIAEDVFQNPYPPRDPSLSGSSHKLYLSHQSDTISLPFTLGGFQSLDTIPDGAGPQIGAVWEWRGDVWDEGDAVAQWLSQILEEKVRLVRYIGHEKLPEKYDMLQTKQRSVDPVYAGDNHHVAFSDGYPVLVASEESRRRLEEEAGIVLDILRFRPNVVISSSSEGSPLRPFDEDNWPHIRVLPEGGGESAELKFVKPCKRCTVPGVDPATGIRSTAPLSALMAIRKGTMVKSSFFQLNKKMQKGTFFGWNAIVSKSGYIQIGCEIEVF